jgi:hypothetical protein
VRAGLGREALAVLALALAGACHKEEPRAEVAEPAPPPPPSASATPADHLAADELVEGDKKAFGLTLPRDVHVDGAFVDLVLASAHLPVHPLVKYFRARLAEGSLREGDEAATFEHVHVPGAPGPEYSVRIWLSGSFTRIELRDTTPRPVPNLPNDAARWRQAGLTPQGRPLDPTHLE